MWYGQRARHRQDACATSFTSEMETLYTKPNLFQTQQIPNPTDSKPNLFQNQPIPKPTYSKTNLFVGFRYAQPNLQKNG
jgi:hypothetical protein